jgi:hypothetical protein
MTNYLYNGVKLPALPEWDKESYPYAVIGIRHYTDISLYTFVASDAPITAYEDTGKTVWKLSYPVAYQITTDNPNVWTSTTLSSVTLEYIWSNHDIYGYTDNTIIVHAASDPVPVNTGASITDFLSFLIGYLFGCRLRAKRAVRKPIGYSYNGTVLPELPEWDKSKYPYAVIAYLDVGQLYRVYYCLEKCTVTGATVSFKAPYVWYSCSGDTWEYMGKETSDSTPIIAMVTPIWANHDILQGDTAYLETSNPVPVYE